MKKHDTLDFDAQAWLSDPALLMCSISARGVLIDMMALAQISRPYGFLFNNGEPLSDQKIMTARNIEPRIYWPAVKELFDQGRIDKSELHGAYFIPRMVRDGMIKQAATEGGKRGGNPNLSGSTTKKSKPITIHSMLKICPDHLSSSAQFKESLEEWFEYRSRKKLILTERAAVRQINTFKELAADEVIRWIECAIDKNWRGIYPPPDNYNTSGDLTAHRKLVDRERAKSEKQERRNESVMKSVNTLWEIKLVDMPKGDDSSEEFKRCMKGIRDKHGKAALTEALDVVKLRTKFYKKEQG